jgi:hypothetical protein
MSNLPQTLHSIKFYNRGTEYNPKWWIEKCYKDTRGEEHVDNYKVAGDGACMLEYAYETPVGVITRKEIIED